MKSTRKFKRNEKIVMLYNKGFSSRQIGEIMGISFVASSYIIRRDNTEQLKKKFESCTFCDSKKDLLFEKKINICKKCAKSMREIV